MERKFEARTAQREAVPLLVGLTGPSSSGKTYSALRLAVGMQKVKPGKIVFIGTESRRALHYADRFDFEYIEFKEPFGSLDYVEALKYAESLNPSVIIVDSMSHEKEGIGGMLDLHEQEVQRMAGNDFQKRERVKMLCWSKPKQHHRAMINKILQINANMIFCFRAKEISKPVKNKKTGKNEVQQMGFVPVASDDLVFEMTLNCMLMPHSNGFPIWESDMIGERMAMKLPAQFKHIFEGKNVQLSEGIGEHLALWSKGDSSEKTHPLIQSGLINMEEVKAEFKYLIANLPEENRHSISEKCKSDGWSDNSIISAVDEMKEFLRASDSFEDSFNQLEGLLKEDK